MLAKAAPPDWAAWFANITGLPIEYVRHKLGMPAESGSITGDQMNKRPPRMAPGTASPHNLSRAGRG